MGKLLLVEDDESLSGELRHWLEAEKHMVDCAGTGEDAMDYLRVGSYDLVILDWNLPDTTGLDLLQKLRAKGASTPVLMLTGLANIENKVMGFESGADDYLTKPFHQKELFARIKALLRRPAADVENVVCCGDLKVNMNNYQVTKDGKILRLSPREFSLLNVFLRHPNVTLSSDFILQRVWPTDSDATADVVRKYVQKLRDKIDSNGKSSRIKTVHGTGYTWDNSEA